MQGVITLWNARVVSVLGVRGNLTCYEYKLTLEVLFSRIRARGIKLWDY